MSPKRQRIFRLIQDGKTYAQIGKIMGINQSNLNSTVYQMRKQGIELKKRSRPLPITPTQNAVLRGYLEKRTVPEIATLLNITCQTVMNHAAEGFKRLGLTTPGIDRIAALRAVLGPETAKPITMDDAFFN